MTKMINEPKANGRKPDGTFAVGNSLGGRTPGARNKLGETFIAALQDDFERHGTRAIADCREKNPAAYLKVIASLMPKDHHIILPDDTELLSDEEVKARIRALASKLGVMMGDTDDRVERLRRINAGDAWHEPVSQEGPRT